MRKSKIIFLVSLILSLCGLLAIYTASWYWGKIYLNNPYYFIQHQLIYLILSIAVSFIIYLLSLETWKKISLFLLIISIFLLYSVFINGIGREIRGVRRWIDFGIVQFQPIEIVRFSLIIFLASFLSKKKKDLSFYHLMWILFFLSLIGVALYFQPNMSMFILIILSTFTILFLSNFDLKKLIPIFFIVLILTSFLIKSASYREERLKNFSIENSILFSSYQQLQAINVIKEGGIFGKGWGRDLRKIYLPESYNDFIFPVILGEGGWIAGFFLTLLYIILIYNCFLLAINEKNIFNYLLISGIISFWCWQILINIFMSLGFLPVMGLPLPFISFGGSSLITNWLNVGLILKIDYSRSEK
jgi:cell division protein FtsW